MMFPGQNSQAAGMGEEAYYNPAVKEEVKRIFDAGSLIIEEDLAEICFGNQTGKLDTSLVQPAIVAAELANYRLMRKRGLSPVLIMGHSLGEIAALGAAEALSIEDVFEITKVRMNVTKQAGIDHPGRMAAVIGLTKEQLDPIMASANMHLRKLGESSSAYAANHNWRLEQVLSGHPDALERVQRTVKRLKGMNLIGRAGVVKLKVPGAFHSPHNEGGIEELREAFELASKKIPKVLLLNNKGDYILNPDNYADYYAEQLVNGVEWRLMMHQAAYDGISDFVEVRLQDDPTKATLSNFVKNEFDGNYQEVSTEYGEVIRLNWTPELSKDMERQLKAA